MKTDIGQRVSPCQSALLAPLIGTLSLGSITPSPDGQKFVNFSHNPTDAMQWRILVFVRESDGKIDDLTYWKLGEPHTFSAEEKRYLTSINSELGPVGTQDNDDEFEVWLK